MSAAQTQRGHALPPAVGAVRGCASIEGQPTFLDCPAYLDQQGQRRCGLPAEVTFRFITRSTSGPVDGMAIRCPAGHFFNAPIEFLRLETHAAAVAPSAKEDALQQVSEPDLEHVTRAAPGGGS